MGKPAARIGDLVAHPPGFVLTGTAFSDDVFIQGRPAWLGREKQAHNCPLHGPGVTIGSLTVTINGYPACRQEDQIIEGDAINRIIGGSETVSIGD